MKKFLTQTSKDIKYVCIIMLGTITGKTIVNWFGVTYIVSGNVVKRFGG